MTVTVPHHCNLCGRGRCQWTTAMMPICPSCDRAACPKCHKRVLDGETTTCTACNADVRLRRADVP